MKNHRRFFAPFALFLAAALLAPSEARAGMITSPEYAVGIGDVLEINVLQPDQFVTNVTVAPDGYISFPYLGNVKIQGMNLTQIQTEIQQRLGDGYIKYPVVTVYLKEARSKKYLVSGEVERPGSYLLEDNMTVLKAISIAGGFTKYGNANRVKILRAKPNGEKGYTPIQVNLKRAMDGDMDEDPELMPGDMVIVSEGIF